MSPGPASSNAMRFSTDDFSDCDRLPFWCEFFSRKIIRCDFEARSDEPLRAEATLFERPKLHVNSFNIPTPARFSRTRNMVADGDDSVAILVNLGGQLTMGQRDLEISLAVGEAVIVMNGEPATMTTSNVRSHNFMVPRSVLASIVHCVDGTAMRRVPKDNDALQLLLSYSEILNTGSIPTPELSCLSVTHVHDLVGMILGASVDGAALAADRGVRAARLRAIRADVLKHVSSAELSVGDVALRNHVTPRYVQMLFEADDTTFSQYLLEQRLLRAHQMLTSPAYAVLTISSIAFAAGFGDLSYFNRCFRRRFGGSPSDLRSQGSREKKS